MEHDTLTTLPCCSASWPLSDAERAAAQSDGMPAYVLTGLEHCCCLEPDHEGLCACQCGVVR